MTYELKIPELGENIHEADVVSVKISAGSRIEIDQIIFEIETGKATIEIPSDTKGIVKEVLIKEGDKVKVGQTVLIVETTVENGVSGSAAASDLKPAPADTDLQPVPAPEPSAGSGAAQSAPAPVAASVVKTPDPVHYITTTAPAPPPPSTIAPAAPTVRRFAREIGIDINKVIGSGPGGRISIDDVKAYSKEENRKLAEAAAAGKAAPAHSLYKEPLPDFSKYGTFERKDMSNIRRKTAEHLSYAWQTIPHVTQFDKADITELEKLRKMYSKSVEASGGKLTPTAILIKVVAMALKEFPQFNTSVDMEKSEVVYKKYYNVGVAVDTDRGLVVPVIRDVDKKNILEISLELNQLAEKARAKKLSLDDMQGGCITITNLGGIGGTYFTPIVNAPEVAILGVSQSSYDPVYIEGKFEPRLMMPLSLSYDHRIIDGADGIRFLRWIIAALQQPFLLALKG